MNRVTILISYRPGNEAMLRMCLDRIKKHTKVPTDIILVVDSDRIEPDLWSILGSMGVVVSFHPQPDNLRGSSRHGRMLDEAIQKVKTRSVLTLDSDCFPVADGWLGRLLGMRATVAGISHGWYPPPSENNLRGIEWRIRSQLNWNNTHVACQLVDASFVFANRLKYANGDDTGLEIPQLAREQNRRVCAIRPSIGPTANKDSKLDPEMNREFSVIFGDMIYHHGAASREDECHLYPVGQFSETRKRVVEKGPEFLLEEGHKYRFDQEEAVADFKLRIMGELMKAHLKNNQSLFKE